MTDDEKRHIVPMDGETMRRLENLNPWIFSPKPADPADGELTARFAPVLEWCIAATACAELDLNTIRAVAVSVGRGEVGKGIGGGVALSRRLCGGSEIVWADIGGLSGALLTALDGGDGRAYETLARCVPKDGAELLALKMEAEAAIAQTGGTTRHGRRNARKGSRYGLRAYGGWRTS